MVFLGTTGIALGATKIVKQVIGQDEYFATLYSGAMELKIYKVVDGGTVCYITNNPQTYSTMMDCVK